MKKYWELFIAFARVGVMTFGGGYAMIPILERELIDKRGWTTNEELMDYYAVAQCTPGVIAAANTSAYFSFFLLRKARNIHTATVPQLKAGMLP